jgi:hypothetical protein
MKILTGLTILAVATGLGTGLSTEPANAATCSGVITVQSSVHKSLTSATGGATKAKIDASYKREFAAARAQALARWSTKVSTSCPGKSHFWLRAKNKKVEECDRAMGGRFAVCASAVPAKKLF